MSNDKTEVPPAVAAYLATERPELLARIEELQREVERVDSGARKLAIYAVGLEEQLELANDGARKGDAARLAAGGMELDIAESLEKIEQQAREIAGLQKLLDRAHSRMDELKALPCGVVLPELERWSVGWGGGSEVVEEAHPNGEYVRWHDYEKLRARLNQQPASGGGVDERAAFEAEFRKRGHLINRIESGDIFCYDTTGMQSAWTGWQARAALSANHSEQVLQMVPAWNLAADVLPACGRPVLAYYLNSHGKGRRIRAEYVKAWTVQADDLSDPDAECVEYSEQEDAYYIRQGWYELIDNWDEYGRIAVHEGVITHWQELPAAPSAGSQGGDV